MMYYSWLLTILLSISAEFYDKKCGYSSCNSVISGVINVHLIAHTHNDVGWLKTIDQYYYGYREDIQSAGVQFILDTVVNSLNGNPARKFSYVEMAYFTKWWKQKDDKIKALVYKLVNQGRLQFLLGGWSMNDEATTHYTAIIDQMTLGLDFLNQTFGDCGRPLVAWQIDSFGHSIEQSNLFALMGYDANILMRIDYRDKDQRQKQLRMEFIQITNFFNQKTANKLFTSILFDTYCWPATFCFDETCKDPPILDDPNLRDNNVKERVTEFADYVIRQSKKYTTNHVLVPMGCDFHFQNAFRNFLNLDKLIFHVNRERRDINVMYSTPACYIAAVNNQNKSYSVKKDDFFPYASGPSSYWTGFFTSRSSLKGFIRESNILYQICKQVQVISMLTDHKSNENVKIMAEIMGIMQHHDAITGTSKQHVSNDYSQKLYKGWSACSNVIGASISKLMTNDKDELNFALCCLLNISYCLPTDDLPYKPFKIVLYNSLAVKHSHWTRIPVNMMVGDMYYVINSEKKIVPSQIIPISNRTRNIPERPRNVSANYELVFKSILPPIGYSTYTIYRDKANDIINKFPSKLPTFDRILDNDFNISNNHLILYYRNNLLYSLHNVKSQLNLSLSQSIRYYNSHQHSERSSGAYIFRPTTTASISFNEPVTVDIITGNLVTEVHQTFSNWATLVTRLYKDSDNVESEWTVGPIPITGLKIGLEVVLQYKTNLKSNNLFYTDSNGRQLVPRTVNERIDYKFNQTEQVAGNFYPVTSDVAIVDLLEMPSVALIIRTDRSLGAGAYESGMVELMVHRRILNDFGAGEFLDELGSNGEGLIVRGKQWFTFGPTDEIIHSRRIENVKRFNKPLILFSKTQRNSRDISSFIYEFSSLQMVIPKNLYFTSLENHFNLVNEVDYQIIRIENLYEMESESTMIDVNEIFNFMKIMTVKELNLSANQFRENVKKLKWSTEIKKRDTETHQNNGMIITISPGEIRTFKIHFKKKKPKWNIFYKP